MEVAHLYEELYQEHVSKASKTCVEIDGLHARDGWFWLCYCGIVLCLLVLVMCGIRTSASFGSACLSQLLLFIMPDFCCIGARVRACADRRA